MKPQTPPDAPAGGTRAPDPVSTSTRQVFEHLQQGDPHDQLRLGDLLADLRQSAFGILLLIAILPAFIPIPGLAGGISGPLVMLVGAQLLIGLKRPWLPKFLAKRGPQRKTVTRFSKILTRPLQWVDWLLRPRLQWVLDRRVASAVTGILLVLLGLLLSLPIPFTNYLFGIILLPYMFALLERDGGLMLISWVVGAITVLIFGVISGNLVQMVTDVVTRWLA